MIAFYLYIFIWHLFSEITTPRLAIASEQRMAFIICGIIGLLGLNNEVKLQHLAYAFVFGAIFSSLYIIFYKNDMSFFQLPLHKQSWLFTYYRIKLVNTHMHYNLYLNISFVFAFYLLLRDNVKTISRIVVILACCWSFYILCLTEGRIGLVTGIIIVAVSTSLFIYKKWGWKPSVPIIVLYAIICAVIISQHKRMDIKNIQQDARVMLWEAGWKTVKENPIFGQGVCDARQSFFDKKNENENLAKYWKKYIAFRQEKSGYGTHPHNTFLEIWSEFGIIGLSTLLFLFLFPLSMQPKQHRMFLYLIVACFTIQCFFDTFLSPILFCFAIIAFTETTSTRL